MINVYLGGILMVLGIIAVLAQPVLGVAMVGAGYWLSQRATAAERYQASALYWGIALLGMVVVTLAGVIGLLV